MTGLQKYNYWLNWLTQVTPDVHFPWLKTTSQGAATQLRVAAMEDEEFIRNGGRYYEDCNVATLQRADIIDDGAKSDELGKLLWNLSEKMIEEYNGAIQ